MIHPSATIDEGAEIGEGTRVWHFSHVMAGARVGAACVLGQGVFVGRGARIGDRVKVQNNVSIFEGVELEDDVFVGPSVVFTNVKNPRSEHPRRGAYDRTLVRRGATLGANVTVVCPVVVGRYAFVGAGAVVTREVPDFALMLGVPARRAGWVSHRGVRLGADLTCPETGQRYAEESGLLRPL